LDSFHRWGLTLGVGDGARSPRGSGWGPGHLGGLADVGFGGPVLPQDGDEGGDDGVVLRPFEPLAQEEEESVARRRRPLPLRRPGIRADVGGASGTLSGGIKVKSAKVVFLIFP